MQSAMNRLSAFVRTRRKLVLGGWLVLLIISIPFASQQTKHLSGGGFEVPGSGADAVDKEIKRFAGQSTEPLGIVLRADKQGDATALTAAVDRVGQAAKTVDHVELSPEGKQLAAKQIAANQDVILFPLAVTGTRDEVLKAAVDLRDELKVGEVTDGAQPYVVGQQALWAGMQKLQQEDLAKAESTGFPIILIVLLAVFGSVLAALLPVGLGVAAVIITGAVVYFISLAITMSVFVTNIASMLGIGVAVDYSLFVLSRYRDEIQAGKSREDALDTAMRTSGATVVFSGITVIVSLAGLFLINSTVMRSLAIGAIVVVAIAIVGAVTLLPGADQPGRPARRGTRQDRQLHRLALPPRAAQAGAAGGDAELLGALVERRDEASRGLRRARRRDPARARHSRVLAGVRQRCAAPVPGRQRDARGLPGGGQARAARRLRADADRRRLQGPGRHRRGREVQRDAEGDARRGRRRRADHLRRRHGRADQGHAVRTTRRARRRSR